MNKLTRSLPLVPALAFLVVAGGGCTKAQRRDRQLRLANGYFQANELDKAEVGYSNAARMMRPPSPVAIRQLGLLYATEGRPGAALWCLQQAAQAKPSDVEVQVKLAQVYLNLDQIPLAREAALEALKIEPGNGEALTVVCETVRTPQELEQTRQYVERLRQQDKDRSSYHLALAMLSPRSRGVAEVESELSKALALDPKSSMAYVALGNVYAAQTNFVKAGEAFKTAAQLAPLRSPARLSYLQFMLRTNGVAQVMENLRELSAQAPDYLPALLLQMRITSKEKKWDECNAVIDKILQRDPSNYEALLERGNVAMGRGEAQTAVADFTRMNSLNPSRPLPQVQYQLALAHLLAGDRNSAVADLSRALAAATNYVEARLLLADLYVRQGNVAAAVNLLSQALKQKLPAPVTAQLDMSLARAYGFQRKPDQALAIYRTLEEMLPKDPRVPWLAGGALSEEGRTDEARKEFEKSLALAPNETPAFEALVELDIIDKRFDQGLDRVKKWMARDPKAALPWVLEAKIYIVRNERPSAEASLQKAIELDPKLPAPYLLLARLYVESKEYPQALERLNVLLSRTNDVSALMEKGEIHDQLKQYDQARESYEKLLKVDPQFGAALNNLAYLYSEHFNQLDKAYALAEKERELAPYDPYVADTLGWILFKRGEYPRALALLEESADKQPIDGEVHYHLGMAHYMMGEEDPARAALQTAISHEDYPEKDKARARLAILAMDPKTATPAVRALLEKQVEADPGDPIALMRLAALQERDGDMEKAAATYEKIVKKNPQDIRAMVRLAQLYSGPLHDQPKGLELARNAHKIAADDPYAGQTLGRLVFATHDYPYALSLLEDAARQLPGQPDLLHDLAWAYFSVGKTAAAASAMQTAVQTGVPFARLDDAKRFLAMLAAAKSPVQAQAALPQIQQTLEAWTNYAPALMALGLAQEQQGRGQEAEQNYEKLLAVYPLFAPASRQLAMLYAHDGDNAKAYEFIEKARPAFPDDAELAKTAGIVAYRRKEYQRSLSLLKLEAQKIRTDAELFYYLGMDYYNLKQPADSKMALQRALALNPPAALAGEAKRVLAELK